MKLKWNEATVWWYLISMLCFKLKLVVPTTVSSATPHGDHDTESESRSTEGDPETYQKQEEDSHVTKGSITLSALERYKHLFNEHRASQLEAVKAIISFGDDSRRYDLVNVMLKQLFKTMESAKQNLTSFGFLPGDPFPENETIREGVSKVLENTALFGDMVLRLPDIVHGLYDRQREWQLLLAWSYGFCIQSQVFEGANEKLLDLMAQEVSLIPSDPNYVNPFKAANQPKEVKQTKDGKKVEKKKTKKKIKRGPRMSHTEL